MFEAWSPNFHAFFTKKIYYLRKNWSDGLFYIGNNPVECASSIFSFGSYQLMSRPTSLSDNDDILIIDASI